MIILRVVWNTFPIMILILIHLMIFYLISVFYFQDTVEYGNGFAPEDGIWTLLVLLTTANNPDISLPILGIS